MANTLSFDQVATLLNATLQQVRGDTAVADINTANFATVAQTALLSGYDPLLNAISQVLTRTYFSVRPYSPKFRGIMMDEQQWGNMVRKVQVVDKDAKDNDEYKLVDGQSVDPYIVNKPKILQLNFYGAQTYSRDLPIFKNQLDVAFSNAAELGAFWQMLYQNLDDLVAQDQETMARLCICNFICIIRFSFTHTSTIMNSSSTLNFSKNPINSLENFTSNLFIPFNFIIIIFFICFIKEFSISMTKSSNCSGEIFSRFIS